MTPGSFRIMRAIQKQALLGIIRHALTFGGGAVVTRGWLDETTLIEGVGAAITLAGIVWSVIDKRNRTAAVTATPETGAAKRH